MGRRTAAVERRYADNLIDGLIEAGFTVAGKHAKPPKPKF
jgi:hypothetical protein